MVWSIGLITITELDCMKVYGKEPSTSNHSEIQRLRLEEILIHELRPKIISIIRKKYGEYLLDNARILPIQKSDTYPQQEFIFEGKVTKRDTTKDIVRITFRAGFDGYKVSDFLAQPLN